MKMENDDFSLAITLPYYLGIVADSLWASGLFYPRLFAFLTNEPNFTLPQLQSCMKMAGIIMTGWTVLLVWAVQDPVERRFVIFLTAFPVVFGFFWMALSNVFFGGNTFQIWIVVKTLVLFVTMMRSYFISERIEAKSNETRKQA